MTKQNLGIESEHNIKFSIIIPARNEQDYIKRCLDSIKAASAPYKNQVEVIVVLNRCTDRTEEIALAYNCVIVKDESKNLSKIRNTGARAARGEILVTIDADSWMSDNMLTEIENQLSTGKYIGGGVGGRPERISLGIIISLLFLVIPMIVKYGLVSVGLFWCFKKDFEAINGFDETLLLAEDADFAMRLKRWGKKCGKAFKTITKAQMFTSSRRFDKLGDWYLVKNPEIILAYLKGTDKKAADEMYYDMKR